MTLYDTAGVERYTQTIPPTYYRKAKVVLLVYSVDNNDSFHAISSNWVDNTSTADDNSIIALVGNKCDLEENEETERFITRQRAHTLASNLEIDPEMVFQISARTGKGFQEMFDCVAVRLQNITVRPSLTLTTHSNNTEITTKEKKCSC